MNTVVVYCDVCHKPIIKSPRVVFEHNFCCREHFQIWNRPRMSHYNRTENPLNRPLAALTEQEQQRARDIVLLRTQGRCTTQPHGWFSSTENPMYSLETRLKAGDRKRGRGEGKAYRKFLGRHEHRVIAEQMLRRELMPNEVVHHIDGNRLNNAPDNLMVMDNREHSRLHAIKNGFGTHIRGGGVQ